jgi:SAM-dependent methyltransferase
MGSENHPYPPFELAERVCSLEGRGEPFAAYERLGAETKSALLRLLGPEWSFEGKRVLDFGCGAGRTLRHFLHEANQAELWGAELDGASVEWLREALCPPLNVVRSSSDPPLRFEDDSFDLIWALSVFTHLTDNSIPWLLELHRLLKPDGLLIATYMGEWNSEALAGEPWDESRVGMNVLRHDQGWDWGGPWVLMSDWWVRVHWGRAFEIIGTEPQVHGQTWVLMRKRAVELDRDDLEAPADDPREYRALRHNVHQLQREIEQIKRNPSFPHGSRALRDIRRAFRGIRARIGRLRH